MYLINYVFGEAKIDCLNEVSKNVRVLGILTSQIADKTISIAAKMVSCKMNAKGKNPDAFS